MPSCGIGKNLVQCVCLKVPGVVCALVQAYSVPRRALDQESHVYAAARPICASHTVTTTELLTTKPRVLT